MSSILERVWFVWALHIVIWRRPEDRLLMGVMEVLSGLMERRTAAAYKILFVREENHCFAWIRRDDEA